MRKWYSLKSFLHHYFSAKSIDAIHSPFVFDFVKNVLRDRRYFYAFEDIEKLRIELSLQRTKLLVADYGTGGTDVLKPRRIRDILNTSVKPKRQAQFLFRLVDHYECKNILEIGTSLGITTLYLSAPHSGSKVITLEGDKQLSLHAQHHFESLSKTNIWVMQGRFEETLPLALKQLERLDFIFFDGNHTREATIQYFHKSLPFATDRSVFVFDDIYHSKEMTEAWRLISEHSNVTLSIDIYFMGIIFFRKELSKQHFLIRW